MSEERGQGLRGGPSDIIPLHEIHSMVKSRPAALALVDSVVDWFGPSLSFFRQPDGTTVSECKPYFCDMGKFIGASVRLCLDEKAPSALVHECLHLKMHMDGFPLPVKSPRRADSVESLLSKNYDLPAHYEIANVVSHTVFLPQFLTMGFDRDEFLFDANDPLNVDELQRSIEEQQFIPAKTTRSRGSWNVIYFHQLVMKQLGFETQLSDILDRGQAMFPGTMDKDAKLMASWVDRGDFRQPSKFASALNELLVGVGMGAMGYAKIVQSSSGIQTIHVAQPPLPL